MKIRSVFPEMSQILLWKNVLSRHIKKSFKNLFLNPDLEADGFQNLISSSLCKINLWQSFHEDPIRSQLLTGETNKQRDRQTNKHRVKT